MDWGQSNKMSSTDIVSYFTATTHNDAQSQDEMVCKKQIDASSMTYNFFV